MATVHYIWLQVFPSGTKFGYNFFEVRSAPGIAMVCFSTSFFRPPLEFQGQINLFNTFQVPVLIHPDIFNTECH